MKVKVLSEAKYKKNAAGVDLAEITRFMRKKGTSAYFDSQGIADVDGKHKRFLVLRVYGDWD